jgi:hypothetical protein
MLRKDFSEGWYAYSGRSFKENITHLQPGLEKNAGPNNIITLPAPVLFWHTNNNKFFRCLAKY